MILLENLRFHIEEEGKGVDSEGNKVLNSVQMKAMHSEVLLEQMLLRLCTVNPFLSYPMHKQYFQGFQE